MTTKVLIECGVAQTRGARLIDDVVWALWSGPAQGDQGSDFYPISGARFTGRVLKIDQTLNAAFVDIGLAKDAFLPLTKSNQSAIVEGQTITAEIKSPPRQQKGAALRFVEISEVKTGPGLLPPFIDPVIQAAHALADKSDEVFVDIGSASQTLSSAGYAKVTHQKSSSSDINGNTIAQAFEAVLDRTVYLDGGGALTIDECQALTSVDVDTAGLSASSPARLREKIAMSALDESIRQISLRNIGGHVVIDFPPLTSDTARGRFRDHLFTNLKKLPGAKAVSFSKSGLLSFTLPHHAQSWVERLTQFSLGDDHSMIIPGRHLTIEAAAKQAIEGLETHLREDPSTSPVLKIGSALANYLENRPQWQQRLAERYSARFEINSAPEMGERSFEFSQQRQS